MTKLKLDFYLNQDAISVGKNLLGKYLFTKIDNIITGGMIVETESYIGPEDKACHAYNNKRTLRTEAMFQKGGIAYVYLCYGIHALLNVVTNIEDIPHAILIRAIKPICGIDTMLKRRNKKKLDKTLTSGPGSLTKALGINKNHNKISFLKDIIWLEDRNIKIKNSDIISSARVGIDYAEEYRDKPWRFRIQQSSWTSLAK